MTPEGVDCHLEEGPAFCSRSGCLIVSLAEVDEQSLHPHLHPAAEEADSGQCKGTCQRS